MDQGVLESLKRRYRKSLLRDILLSEEQPDIVKFIKSVNMKVVVEKIALSWNEITPLTIRRSWRKLLPLEDSSTIEDTMDDGTMMVQLTQNLYMTLEVWVKIWKKQR